MDNKGAIDIVVRPKRQVTLPRNICMQLGISPGDKLELVIDGNCLVARHKKTVAMEALSEIRNIFKRCGISEEELQESGREVRRQLAKDRHAKKA